jgi:competence protein ComEC
MMESRVTRFRAYHLGNAGSSFSYFANGHFTVIEGRMNDASKPSLVREMDKCGVTFADTLHITSWDNDHCAQSELGLLLDLIKPTRIERPGYDPYTVTGIACLDLLKMYEEDQRRTLRPVRIEAITPDYITLLDRASSLAFKDTLYNPMHIDESCGNNNSTVKHFRRGSFNVLSLGDVESPNIGARLRRDAILGRETDVMILAHHGADNGFTTKKLLRHLEPKVAICTADYSNQYDHPRPEIRELLYDEGVRLYTTKTGDVVIKSIGDHNGTYRAVNLIGKSKNVSSQQIFTAKKKKLLGFNDDTLRQVYAPRPSYRRL